MKTETAIKKHLQSGRSLTSLQALHLYGTMRAAEYVRRLRSSGMNIKMTRVQKKDKWYGKYYMA